MLNLAFLFLVVSCVALTFHLLAFVRLAARRASTPTEELVGGGYLRTVACRVLAGTVYVAVAVVQVAGRGSLTVEALAVFTFVQVLWISNSALDVRIRRRLTKLRRRDG